MPIEGMKTFIAYCVAILLGIYTGLVSFLTPLQEEVPQLLKKSEPTPVLTEQTRALSKEEESTMAASFIKEFEMMMASGGGKRE